MIKQLIEQYYIESSQLRQSIHQEPEIAFEEIMTSQKVMRFLDRHGIPYQSKIAKTGILATIKGNKPGRTVLLRADMDALPMDENPTNPFASTIPGRMHACGHDGHTAGLCLSAAVLNQMKDEIHGTIKFLFQPAEEAEGGALPMIEEGVLDGVDGAFGAHLWGSSKEGTISLKSGVMMASPDNFKITVKGVGGHGSAPHLAIDPIVIASQIVVSLQTIVSRNVSPLESCVITVGKFHGGTAPNIIPEEVILEGTLRTLNNDVRAVIPNQMKKLVESIAISYGGRADFEYLPAYPVLVNDETMTTIAYQAIKEFSPMDKIIRLDKPDMGGEDFAYIAQSVPSCFMYVGIMKDKPISHHHPDFYFDDLNLKILSEAMIRCALNYLKSTN
jgi:amidohydrolase